MRLHVITLTAISVVTFLMSACSPMNSEFSCNATAGDSCMTIEQVDAMTRYADEDRRVHPEPLHIKGGHARPNDHQALVWVSPRNKGRSNALSARFMQTAKELQ